MAVLNLYGRAETIFLIVYPNSVPSEVAISNVPIVQLEQDIEKPLEENT